jgi:hypothetical protein
MPRMWWRGKARPCWTTVPIRHRTSLQEATWKAAEVLGLSARFYIEPRYMSLGFPHGLQNFCAIVLPATFGRQINGACLGG